MKALLKSPMLPLLSVVVSSGIFLLITIVYLSPTVCLSSETRNLYEVLGLDRTATTSDISRAFRVKSKALHPDRTGGDAASTQQYIELQHAYEVLADLDMRALYDIGGEDALEKAKKYGIENMPRSSDYQVSTAVNLDQAYTGLKHVFSISRHVVCSACHGTGGEGSQTEPCRKCRGTGKVEKLRQLGIGFTVRMDEPCDVCDGTGHRIKKKCPVCHGHKLVKESKELEIQVPPGMEDGHVVTFRHASEQVVGAIPGDVNVILRVMKHPTFERKGHDLHTTMEITLKEALIGFRRSIEQLDGRPILVEKDGVTQHGEVMTIKGEGMPHLNVPSEHGDLFVKFTVTFPSVLTVEQTQRLEESFRVPKIVREEGDSQHPEHIL